MKPKPKHLGPEYASQFSDKSVVEVYHHRPLYPVETFRIVAELVIGEPKVVLDAGCGTGPIARELIDYVDRIDAVDISSPMIAKGRIMSGGTNPHLHWLLGPMETVPLNPPYGLITAGASLHWMDWEVVLPRFKDVLHPGGYVCLVGKSGTIPDPWRTPLLALITRYSTNRDYQPYDIVQELESRGLFQKIGDRQTAPTSFKQSIESYVESIHSRNGFSRDRMSPEMAEAFDAEARALLSSFHPSGEIELQIMGTVTWGRPLARKGIR
jgi:ubiquinone/menaquinone biosynthesis C-methylase UbiE